MGYNPQVHHRRSIRLRDHDYAQPGLYFVTLCVRERACVLGSVEEDRMILNADGLVVAETWQRLAQHFPAVHLDEWVVMPNHLHGIVQIVASGDACAPAPTAGAPGGGVPGRGASGGGASRRALTSPVRAPKPLGQIVGAFKTMSTKQINARLGTPAQPFWQRNYYERVIRGGGELDRIRQYIRNNPSQWAKDQHNPATIGPSAAQPDDPTL